MEIKPIGNRILIEPKTTEEKTAGGIYIPDTAKEKTNEGKVVAVGDGKDVKEGSVAVGDSVMYESYAGTDVKAKDKKYIIVSIKDIIAKIE